jgi:hypothetical protein
MLGNFFVHFSMDLKSTNNKSRVFILIVIFFKILVPFIPSLENLAKKSEPLL